MHIRALFISVLFIFVACKKDPIQYSFEGNVTSSVDQLGLEDVEVKAYQLPFQNSVATSNFELMAETLTDINGDYKLVFEREKATEFKLEFSRPGFFFQEIPLGAADVSSEDVNLVNTQLDAKSWVKFDILNLSPANQSDELQLILYEYRKGCEGCATQDYNYFNGILDTSITYLTTAGSYFRFTYVDVESGFSTTDSLHLTPFDTLTYSINY